jgi:hypothetical protein
MSYRDSYENGGTINTYQLGGNFSRTSYNQIIPRNQDNSLYPFIQPGNLGDYK